MTQATDNPQLQRVGEPNLSPPPFWNEQLVDSPPPNSGYWHPRHKATLET